MEAQVEQPLVEMKVKIPANVRDRWTQFCQKHDVNRHGQTQRAIEQTMEIVEEQGWMEDGTEVEGRQQQHS